MVGRGGAAGNTWLVPRLGGAGSLVEGLSGAGLGGGPGLLGVGLGGALGGAAVGATGGSVGRSVGLGWHMVDGPGQVGGFGSNGLNGMVRVGGPGMPLGCVGLGPLLMGGDGRAVLMGGDARGVYAVERQVPATASAGSGVCGSGFVHRGMGGWGGGSLRPAAAQGGKDYGKGQKVKSRQNRPSVRLTAQLLDTYKRINDKYYRRQVT